MDEEAATAAKHEARACCSAERPAHLDPTAPRDHEGIIPEGARSTDLRDMVHIPGGWFLMGTDTQEGFSADGEGPVRKVHVSPFYMDSCTVTNREFARFVDATAYQTEAETYGWSFVFYQFLAPDVRDAVTQVVPGAPWWCAVMGASWRQPEGPRSDIASRMDHPVVHVSWNDARAYCQWARTRLPTEAEWEMAARGGLIQKRYPWGDELTPSGEHQCNIWQGTFPTHNTIEDGHFGTAPARSFKSNGFGLYNMSGNVWEWCQDWFTPHTHLKGGNEDPQGPTRGTNKVIRGGSYLCHDSYCNRYRVAARSANTPDSSGGNLGFRCVVSADAAL